MGKLLEFLEKSAWATANRYFFGGELLIIPSTKMAKPSSAKWARKIKEDYISSNTFFTF